MRSGDAEWRSAMATVVSPPFCDVATFRGRLAARGGDAAAAADAARAADGADDARADAGRGEHAGAGGEGVSPAGDVVRVESRGRGRGPLVAVGVSETTGFHVAR